MREGELIRGRGDSENNRIVSSGLNTVLPIVQIISFIEIKKIKIKRKLVEYVSVLFFFLKVDGFKTFSFLRKNNLFQSSYSPNVRDRRGVVIIIFNNVILCKFNEILLCNIFIMRI